MDKLSLNTVDPWCAASMCRRGHTFSLCTEVEARWTSIGRSGKFGTNRREGEGSIVLANLVPERFGPWIVGSRKQIVQLWWGLDEWWKSNFPRQATSSKQRFSC